MAKASPKRTLRKQKIEVTQVPVKKVSNRITLDSLIEQLGEKAASLARKRGADPSARDRATKIKDLAEALGKELRGLRRSLSPSRKAPGSSKR